MLAVKSAQSYDKCEHLVQSSIGGVWDLAACPQLKRSLLLFAESAYFVCTYDLSIDINFCDETKMLAVKSAHNYDKYEHLVLSPKS